MPHEVRVVSAHRTPDLLFEYAATAEARGLEVIIAGAGGAAHLPGMAAAKTRLPVLGVPVESKALHGIDSLLSIVQMPAGVPVGTLAIGRAGAINAALLAAAILARQAPGVPRRPCGATAREQTAGRAATTPTRGRGAHDASASSAAASSGGCWPWPATRSACASASSTPPPRRPAGQLAELRRRRLTTTSTRLRPLRRRPRRRHLRVRERARRAGPAPGASRCPSTRRRRRWRRPRTGSPRRRSSDGSASRRRRSRRRRRAPSSTRPLATIGLPAVLKTRRFGYDGKGQACCATPARRRRGLATRSGGVPLILEGFVPFERELSILAVRGRDGETALLPARREPPPRRHPAARRSPRPPDLTAELQAAGGGLRRGACWSALDYVGVLAIEFFEVGRRAAGQRDGPARPQLRPLDDRGRRDEPVREPPAGRARPAARLDRGASGTSAMVNLIGTLPAPRRRARRAAGATCTCTARRRGRAASSGTSPWSRRRRRHRRGGRAAARRSSPRAVGAALVTFSAPVAIVATVSLPCRTSRACRPRSASAQRPGRGAFSLPAFHGRSTHQALAVIVSSACTNETPLVLVYSV